MKYYKRYKEADAKAFEVTKEEALRSLEGWWQEEALNEALEEGLAFRLFTPVAEIWTKDDKGMIPMPGFYGICK